MDQERINELTRRGGNGASVDLTDQKAWISRALQEGNGWGEVTLDPSDNIRAIKRRTTVAGKEMGKAVRWHKKSSAQALIFQAVDPNSIVKRPRRVASQLTDDIEAAEAPKRRGRKSQSSE